MGNESCRYCALRLHYRCEGGDCGCSYCAELARHRKERAPGKPAEPKHEPNSLAPLITEPPKKEPTPVVASRPRRFPTVEPKPLPPPPKPKPKPAKRPWCSECKNRLYHEDNCSRWGLPMNQYFERDTFICVCLDSVIDNVGECQTCHRPWIKGHSPNRDT